jgi:Family of unknown function (DUF5906)/Bifunctional DNA primase/polymerase, N-terminal
MSGQFSPRLEAVPHPLVVSAPLGKISIKWLRRGTGSKVVLVDDMRNAELAKSLAGPNISVALIGTSKHCPQDLSAVSGITEVALLKVSPGTKDRVENILGAKGVKVRIAEGANESVANDNGPDDEPPTDPASAGLVEPVADDGDEDAGGDRGDERSEIALDAATPQSPDVEGVEPSIPSLEDATLTHTVIPTFAVTIGSPENITAQQSTKAVEATPLLPAVASLDAPPAAVQAAPAASATLVGEGDRTNDNAAASKSVRPKDTEASESKNQRLLRLKPVAKALVGAGIGFMLVGTKKGEEGEKFPIEKGWNKPENAIRSLKALNERLAEDWVYERYRNFGIPGGANDLLIIDLDNKNRTTNPDTPFGTTAWAGLIEQKKAEGCEIPNAPVVISPSGGEHWYFRQRQNCPPIGGGGANGISPNIDIIGHIAGQVLAPGSQTAAGEYKSKPGTPNVFEAFKSGTIPEIPEWLDDLIRKKGSSAATDGKDRAPPVPLVPADLLKRALALISADRFPSHNDWFPVVTAFGALSGYSEEIEDALTEWSIYEPNPDRVYDIFEQGRENKLAQTAGPAFFKINKWLTGPGASKAAIELAAEIATYELRENAREVFDDEVTRELIANSTPDPEAGAAPGPAVPPVPEWVARLNAEGYAIVRGLDRVAKIDGDGAISFESREAFKTYWDKLRLRVTGSNRSIGQGSAWLKHPARADFTNIGVWKPGEEPIGALNQFKGLAVARKKGLWPKVKDFLLNVICSGDPELYKYVLNWSADLLQNPTIKGYVALVLVGEQGTGKTFFGTELLGSYFRAANKKHLTTPNHLVGKFNAHLLGQLYVLCNEAMFGGDKATRGAFKAAVTEDTILIEKKGVDIFEAPCATSLVFCSNNVHTAVHVEEGDRRSTIIPVSDRRKEDTAYFKRLIDALEAGEREAFLDGMLARDLSGYDRRKCHDTDAKKAAIRATAGSTAQWYIERLESGILPGLDGSIRQMQVKLGERGTDWETDAVTVLRDLAWQDYQHWLRSNRTARADVPQEWGRVLQRVCPDRQPCRPWVSAAIAGAEDPLASQRKGRERGDTYPNRARCLELMAEVYGSDPQSDD